MDRARYSAEVLLAHCLGVERLELYTHFDRPLQEEELATFRPMLKRKNQREPLEYILGEVEFYHCQIGVNPSVLIPRQETEILLDLICQRIQNKTGSALDLCTGSGCLAIGLKKTFSEIRVTAVDICEEALSLAGKNGGRNQVEVDWRLGNLLEPVAGEKFDLVICNPPYITEEEYTALEPEVRGFEPKKALVSGASGIEFYERLAKELPSVLNPGAQVFFEVGAGQKEKVLPLFSKNCWGEPCIEPDWAGNDRFFFAVFLENE